MPGRRTARGTPYELESTGRWSMRSGFPREPAAIPDKIGLRRGIVLSCAANRHKRQVRFWLEVQTPGAGQAIRDRRERIPLEQRPGGKRYKEEQGCVTVPWDFSRSRLDEGRPAGHLPGAGRSDFLLHADLTGPRCAPGRLEFVLAWMAAFPGRAHPDLPLERRDAGTTCRIPKACRGRWRLSAQEGHPGYGREGGCRPRGEGIWGIFKRPDRARPCPPAAGKGETPGGEASAPHLQAQKKLFEKVEIPP